VFQRRAIAIGMSDDEVLNLAGWGVPDRIERSRDGRIPREVWTYERPNGDVRWLFFTNTKLTAIDVQPSAQQVAGFVLR
jgi:hypothetical protein